MKYQIGDLLVKTRGKPSIQYVSKVSQYYDNSFEITLYDMESGRERNYLDLHIDSWSFYKHYGTNV